MKKSLYVLICLVGMNIFPDFLFAYNPMFEKWVEQFDMLNPSVRARRYMDSSFRSASTANFLLPDLELKTRILRNGAAFTATQVIPFPTKMIYNSKVYKNDAASNAAVSQQITAAVRVALKSGYLNAYFFHRQIEIFDTKLNLLKETEDQINAQVVSGLAPEQKLLSIEIEILKLEDKLLRLHEDRDNSIEMAASLLDYKVDRDDIKNSLSNVSLGNYDFSKFDAQQVSAASASYMIEESSYKTARAMKGLSLNRLLPDLIVEAQYQTAAGSFTFDDNMKLMIKLGLPITGFRKAAELQAISSMIRMRRSRMRAVQNQTAFKLTAAVKNYMKNMRSYTAYKEKLNNLVFQNFLQMQASYISSEKVSAVDFIDAVDKLIDVELTALMYAINSEREIFNFEMIAGKPIEEVEGVQKSVRKEN